MGVNKNKGEGFDLISAEENIEVLKKQKEHFEQRFNAVQFKMRFLILSSVLGGFLGYAIVAILKNYISLSKLLPYIILGSLLCSFFYFYTISLLRLSLQNNIRRIGYRLVKLGVEELQDNLEENFFTNLVQMNFKYLDQYYLQTKEQADKSFRLAQTASIIGLLIIGGGIFMMFLDKTSPAYVTTASGVISEIIAALFFYLYNRTVLKMSEYHQKLVITQNISLALKITEDVDSEQKNKLQEKIVDRLTIDVNKYLVNGGL